MKKSQTSEMLAKAAEARVAEEQCIQMSELDEVVPQTEEEEEAPAVAVNAT